MLLAAFLSMPWCLATQAEKPVNEAATKQNLATHQVINVGKSSSRTVSAGPNLGIIRPPSSPLPVDWIPRTLVLNKGETIMFKAPKGKKIKTITASQGGIVTFQPIDPTKVLMKGVGPGTVRVAVTVE
jgi:hypothetical protein